VLFCPFYVVTPARSFEHHRDALSEFLLRHRLAQERKQAAHRAAHGDFGRIVRIGRLREVREVEAPIARTSHPQAPGSQAAE
jgi:hypothetical protein